MATDVRPPERDGDVATHAPVVRLSRRETSWLLHRCARHGHVTAYLDDPIAEQFSAVSSRGGLDRCLRCGSYVDPPTQQVRGQVVGSPTVPVPLSAVPQVVRGSHGRKLALLRLLALERGGRGLLLLFASLGIAQLASSHVALAEFLGKVAEAAQPLGNLVGWNVAQSSIVHDAVALLGHQSGTYTTIAWLVAAYGTLQITEAVGLWGGWRWAEYLAAIATTLFIPLEVYEIHEHATIWKVGALLVNLVAVGYLVYKGRLFRIRGGHAAAVAEVRDATLLADELRHAGRSTEVLSNGRIV